MEDKAKGMIITMETNVDTETSYGGIGRNHHPRQRHAPRRRRNWLGIILGLLVTLAIMAAAVAAVWMFLIPNQQMIQTYSLDKTRLIVDQGLVDIDSYDYPVVKVENNQALIAYEVVKQLFDPYLHWDADHQLLIMTNETAVLEMQTAQLTAYLNDQPVALEMPVIVEAEIPYIPIQFFADYYRITPVYHESTNTVTIHTADIPVQKARVSEQQGNIRLDASIKEPIVAQLAVDTEVAIIGEKGHWYRVMTEDGIFGYIAKSDIVLSGIYIHKSPEAEPHVAWKPLGGKINLTWEQVHSKTPDPADIGSVQGVNVLSPTWLHLKDAQGNVSGAKISPEYITWAHEQGIHIWALYSNQFDPDMTREFLKNPDARKQSIAQLLGYAKMHQFDGINIDFENVYYEDKDLLTQYVRELTPYLREQGLVVSIDVTILSQSPNWSMIYDRVAYADTVDYVMVMTYDEHWGASPVAGSVASLPWVERGLQGVLEQVPKDKLIMGVPFYTRIWKEEAQADGTVKVSSRAVSMNRAWESVEQNQAEVVYDDKTKQYYAEYYEGKDRYRIWLETVESMEERVKLVRKYDLAGIASWSRGFEQPEIWDAIETFLQKQPKELVLQDTTPVNE